MPIASGIYYAEYDEGRRDEPPVILIHGQGSNHLAWPAALRRLSGQRVLAVDLPGHGKSAGIGQHAISGYSAQIMELLAELGLYQAVFVGHSMGGAIALDLALHHPSHVAGLGLIATGAYLSVDQGLLDNLSSPVTFHSALQSYQSRSCCQETPPALIDRYMESMKETRPSVLYSDWRACADFDLRGSISQIEAPTWVIAGAEDRLLPVAFAHFLAGSLPAARLQLISGAGHLVYLEKTSMVVHGLQQFLAALSAARFAAARVRLPVPAQVNAFQRKET